MKKYGEPGRVFVRVYELPRETTNGYCMGGGVPIVFNNVDWFTVAVEDKRDAIVEFIKRKRYYHADGDFLVLGDEPEWTFVIEATV